MMPNIWVIFSFGIIMRTSLFILPSVNTFLLSRPEITTPATSWEKVTEGLEVFNHTGLLHNGDSYQGSTFMLLFAYWLKQFPPFVEKLVFLACDAITAMALYNFAATFLNHEFKSQREKRKNNLLDVKSILLSDHHIKNVPIAICLLYFLNPFTISTCVVKSTLTISNMFIALFLNEIVKSNIIISMLFLAVSSYETFYSVQLIFAACLCFYKYNKSGLSLFACCMCTLLSYSFWIMLIVTFAYFQENSLSLVFKHIYFILTVPDLTPNVGIFWYFFTEIFDHFQMFFLFVFQFHVVIFSLPMSYKLKSQPVLFAFVTIGIISVFKSYPSYGDAAFWLSMLPLWSHTFAYLRVQVVGSVMTLTAVILCPVMWNLWIFAQSGNANFFFAATLVYNMGQIFILADIMRAYLEWNVHLKKGLKLKMEDSNEDAKLRLLD